MVFRAHLPYSAGSGIGDKRVKNVSLLKSDGDGIRQGNHREEGQKKGEEGGSGRELHQK